MKKVLLVTVLAAVLVSFGSLNSEIANLADLPSQHSVSNTYLADLPSQHSQGDIYVVDLPSQHGEAIA